MAFTTGGLPNGANSATVTGMSLSSFSGFLTTSTPAVTGQSISVTPGSSFTVKFSSDTCSPGVGFSASGNLTYTASGAAGSATYSATGTIAGTGS